MEIKNKSLEILLAFVLTLFCASSGFSAGNEDRPTISDAEYARAWVEVQNIFSRHAYYHAINNHIDEWEDIWVSKDGPYFATASWDMRGHRNVGQDLYDYYVVGHEKERKKSLEDLSKINPEIENVPENLGVGYWLIHTQTTPIIEIAGDGKTAKGIWYSPGFGFATHAKNSEVEIGGYWYWEKYGVDFIKEGGKWKIWHVQTRYDLMPKYGEAWDEVKDYSNYQEGVYKPWSPTTIPSIDPKFPEPYYTFSETFSY